MSPILISTGSDFLSLQNALLQQGPWKGEKISVDKEWVVKQLKNKIGKIDWDVARRDIQPFLRPKQLTTLDLWDKKFFEGFVDSLSGVDCV